METVLKGKIAELLEQLKNEEKVVVLSAAKLSQLDKDVTAKMIEFRQEFSRKQEQSNADAAKVILLA